MKHRKFQLDYLNNNLDFTYTDFDCYVSATFYVIKTVRTNQVFLTGFLNSSLCAYWLRFKGKMQGNNYPSPDSAIKSIFHFA